MDRMLVVVLGLLFAQESKPPAGLPAQISGKAVHAKTREALRKTQVTLLPADGKGGTRVVITNSDGSFHFKDLPEGRYSLTAFRGGFITAREGTPAKPLELKQGQDLRNVELGLVPQSVLAGKVIDIDGDPVPNAQITAMKITVYGGYKQVQTSASTHTNDIGEFRIPSLFAGRYLLMVTYQRQPTAAADQFLVISGEDYAPTYYPSASTSAAASPIEIGLGEDSLNNVIRMRRVPVYRISGRLSGATREAQGIRLFLVSDDKEAMRTGFSLQHSANLSQGRFTFPPVPPGPYQVIALRGGQQQVTVAKMPVTVAHGDIEDLNITLGEPVRIAGRIRVEGDKPVLFTKLGVRLQVVESAVAPALDLRIDRDGLFEAEAAPREKHLLLLQNLPEDLFIRSIHVANEDATNSGVDLTYAPATAQIEVVLAASPGAVEGIVHDGANLAAKRIVTLVPDPPEPNQPWRTQQAVTNERGQFRFGGLAPGVYRVHAWDELSPEQYGDPAILRHFESKGVKVDVREGITERVEVAVIPEKP